MKHRSPEVDAYIERAPAFAKPILKRIRRLFHKGCPELVETIKWGAPFFEHHGILGSMSAFKEHVSWGFWKAKLMDDPHGLLEGVGNTQMAMARAATAKELPADAIFVQYVREAVRLNEEGVQPKRKKIGRKALTAPPDLLAALKKNKKAATTFEAFAPSARRDYVEWITEAKRADTRARRVAQAVEWMAEGKRRNWKYERPRKG